jgi:hypothetical protein
MCKICAKVLHGFEIEHTEQTCPLRISRYCSYCAQYGHLTSQCPAKPSILFRKPAYLEQLIPPSELDEFGIKTKTPIKYKGKAQEKDEPQQLLEIKDDDRVIIAYLISHSLKISRKSKENRMILEEYANLQNKRLIYVQE